MRIKFNWYRSSDSSVIRVTRLIAQFRFVDVFALKIYTLYLIARRAILLYRDGRSVMISDSLWNAGGSFSRENLPKNTSYAISSRGQRLSIVFNAARWNGRKSRCANTWTPSFPSIHRKIFRNDRSAVECVGPPFGVQFEPYRSYGGVACDRSGTLKRFEFGFVSKGRCSIVILRRKPRSPFHSRQFSSTDFAAVEPWPCTPAGRYRDLCHATRSVSRRNAKPASNRRNCAVYFVRTPSIAFTAISSSGAGIAWPTNNCLCLFPGKIPKPYHRVSVELVRICFSFKKKKQWPKWLEHKIPYIIHGEFADTQYTAD